VTITYRVRVANNVQSGNRICLTSKFNYDSNGDGTNDTTTTANTCVTANCAAQPPAQSNLGPGLLPDFVGVPSDQKAGSVLIFPLYTSDPSSPNLTNTRINLTNTSTTSAVSVHLFFVDGATCNVADRYLCLTANQTTSLTTVEFDPGTTGHLVVVAVDSNGFPLNHNHLIGDAYVKTVIDQTRFFGNYGAEAYAALRNFISDPTATTTSINFDGVDYDYALKTLALSNIGSRADGNFNLISIVRTGGNLGTGIASLGSLFALLYDDQEDAASFNFSGSCQLRGVLSNTFPGRASPRFDDKIPTGRSGWLRFFMTGAGGMVGVSIRANATDTGFNGAHMLHKLTLTTDSYVMPIFQPGC
jgi:hypothetical protein